MDKKTLKSIAYEDIYSWEDVMKLQLLITNTGNDVEIAESYRIKLKNDNPKDAAYELLLFFVNSIARNTGYRAELELAEFLYKNGFAATVMSKFCKATQDYCRSEISGINLEEFRGRLTTDGPKPVVLRDETKCLDGQMIISLAETITDNNIYFSLCKALEVENTDTDRIIYDNRNDSILITAHSMLRRMRRACSTPRAALIKFVDAANRVAFPEIVYDRINKAINK